MGDLYKYARFKRKARWLARDLYNSIEAMLQPAEPVEPEQAIFLHPPADIPVIPFYMRIGDSSSIFQERLQLVYRRVTDEEYAQPEENGVIMGELLPSY